MLWIWSLFNPQKQKYKLVRWYYMRRPVLSYLCFTNYNIKPHIASDDIGLIYEDTAAKFRVMPLMSIQFIVPCFWGVKCGPIPNISISWPKGDYMYMCVKQRKIIFTYIQTVSVTRLLQDDTGLISDDTRNDFDRFLTNFLVEINK